MSLENARVVARLDAFALAGSNAAVVLEQPAVVVADGGVTIQLTKIVENPALCGIEIIASTAPAPAPSPSPPPDPTGTGGGIRINAGGGTLTDAAGLVWMADAYFGGQGKAYATTPCLANGVAHTANAALFCTQRYYEPGGGAKPYAYNIPVPAAAAVYDVRLHFAETYFAAVGLRQFDVWVEGILAVGALDLVAAVGPRAAYSVTQRATVADGFVTIEFIAKIQNPFVSAIEILPLLLGIAFDPMDAGLSNPPVYCTSNLFFHGEYKSSSGQAINGKVHRVSGANLDVVENVITGLPVSDHDHGRLKPPRVYC